MEITFKTDTAEQFVDLLARLAQGASAPALTEIADAIAHGNAELMAQLNQMRQAQTETKESLMHYLDPILEKMNAQRGTLNSLTVFISGMEQRLTQAVAGADPETQQKVQDILREADANTQVIADAIDNDPNTPAKPTDPAEGGGETPTPTEPAPTDPAPTDPVVTPPGGPTTPPDAPTPTGEQPASGSITGG